jgi:hypothetical protein
MAKTISQLPDATSVADGDELIVQQSGVTKRATKLEVIAGIKDASIANDAAIAGSKISPDFAAQNIATTGNVTAAKLIPTGTSATGNGMYLPASNAVAFSTNGSERMRIDASGNVGIGTTVPASKFAVSTGDSKKQFTVDISADPVVKVGLPDWYNTGSIAFVNGSGGERMRITSGGEVYIAGTTDQGAFNLQCNGTGVWGAGAYTNGSDERLKENVADITEGLEVVKKLRPVSFNYKPEHSKDTSKQAGFIAQELLVALEGKDYLEGTVSQGPEFYNVAYQNLIPVLAKAIQELSAKVEALEAANA